MTLTNLNNDSESVCSSNNSTYDNSERPKLTTSYTSNNLQAHGSQNSGQRSRRKSYDSRTKVVYRIEKVGPGNGHGPFGEKEVSTCIFKHVNRITLGDFKKVFKPEGRFKFYFEESSGTGPVRKTLVEEDWKVLPWVEKPKSRTRSSGTAKVICCVAVEVI